MILNADDADRADFSGFLIFLAPQASVLIRSIGVVQIRVVLAGVEAGAGLGAVAKHIAMTDDLCLRISIKKFAQKSVERHDLFGGTSVARTVIFGQTTLVADADACRVESLAVRPDLHFRSAWPKSTVARNVIVIADVRPTVMFDVVVVKLFDGVVLARSSRAAMDDKILDSSHKFVYLFSQGDQLFLTQKL